MYKQQHVLFTVLRVVSSNVLVRQLCSEVHDCGGIESALSMGFLSPSSLNVPDVSSFFYFHCNVLSESPEILCQKKLIFYLWLSVPGNSKTMHCGILILQIYVMRYYREEQEITQVVQNTIWLLLLYTTVQGEWRYHYSWPDPIALIV